MRKIIHIDMDAFYASVEQRDRPELKGKPVIVGGDPNSRGVVATCSYEARKFGVHSAMASSIAYRLCPQGIFVRPRFDVYEVVSKQIREIFHRYTDLVEPLSLDEAYLDVTENKKNIPYAADIARTILKNIREETGLTASAGVSFNKFLAKVASDIHKPNGLTVVTPKNAAKFIDKLPIGKFFGVGKVTEKKMLELGIKTGADLKKKTRKELIQYFGKVGDFYYEIANGLDDRPVNPHRERKSIGQEQTLARDINDLSEMLAILEKLALGVEEYLKERLIKGRTITLKIKYFDFKSITRSITAPEPVCEAADIMKYIPGLLEKTEAGQRKVRLLGVSVSNFAAVNELTPNKNFREVQEPLL
ncbi:MAG: DNA polymerase IV [Acidobacteria bacterium]|jgi:DNA polymerase-4|nr:DNA polymerase IV [Acidobacteriota bacterium]